MRRHPWIAIAAALGLPAMATASVPTYHNSNLRHGAYIVRNLTLAAAANMHRDTHFNATVSGSTSRRTMRSMPLRSVPDSQDG